MNDHSTEITTAAILLVGDTECGKSTFLSRLKAAQTNTNDAIVYLHDTNQPFTYDVRFSKKALTLKFYDTAYPNHHWSTLQPDVVILAFDISNRDSLPGLKGWRNDITRYFQHGRGEGIPVMMLGLKRDLRVEGEGVIYPQESYRIAQELRCDRYAECSAFTGELLGETFEDIATLAATAAVTDGGGLRGYGCVVM